MNISQLSRRLMLTGLLLLLTACTTSTSLQTRLTPTVNTSVPALTATAQPSPTPSSFGGVSASLGPLPQTCSLSSIHMPKTISPGFGPMVGDGPVWAGGFSSYKHVPFALLWSSGEDLSTHSPYGWGHKLLWVVATTLHGSVTIHVTNLSTGTPLYPDAEYAEASSTPTTLVLDPSNPTVLNRDANRDAQWTQFPGGLTVPGAGCYTLEATWPGGSWRLIFAAGLVPGSS